MADLGEHPAATQERRRIVGLLRSYEDSCVALRRAMAEDGIGDPGAVESRLEMLRLLIVSIDK
jgi:hypothetical protein